MKIFEVVNKNFYHGSYDKLEPGTVLTPKGKDYEAAWGGTGFYGALEKHRPPEQLAHKEGVFMVANPDDVDNAGGATDYIYAVVPMGEPQRHDMNWGTAISSLLDNGARRNDSEIKFAADQYWSGKPHPDGNSVWEFIAPRAKIVSELAEGNKAQKGIPANATLSKLDKIRSTTKDPAKRKRAHWLANMRRGSNKK